MAKNDNNDGNATGFNVVRVLQVITLIPAWAMLASIISDYNSNGELTPSSIQFLFAITLICSIWSFCVLITFIRAKNTALWMTFFDILAMALLIAGVVWLSNIANVECMVVTVVTNYQTTNTYIPPPTESSVVTDPMNNVQNFPSDLNPDDKYWNNPRRVMARFIAEARSAAVNHLQKRQYITNANGQTVEKPLYYDQCGLIKAAWGLAIANIILFFISAILSAVIYKEKQQQQQKKTVVREKIIVESPPVIPVQAPPPVFQEPMYGPPPSTVGGGRRHSRSSRSGGGSRSQRHHHRRGSRTGPEYYA